MNSVTLSAAEGWEPPFQLDYPSPADIEFLEDRLYDFYLDATGVEDGRSLGVFLRDESPRFGAVVSVVE